MPTEKPRFTITVSDEMFKDIEDFRYENRFPTRMQALNEILRRGIEAVKREKAETEKASKSKK